MYIGLHPPTKKGCGPTQGKGLDYVVRSLDRVVLTISTKHKKATRPLSSKLASECGTIICNRVSLNVKSWKHIPWVNRKGLFKLLLVYSLFIFNKFLTKALCS